MNSTTYTNAATPMKEKNLVQERAAEIAQQVFNTYPPHQQLTFIQCFAEELKSRRDQEAKRLFEQSKELAGLAEQFASPL